MSRSSENKKSGNWTNQRRTNFHVTRSLACLLPWICLALPLLLPSARTKMQTWRTQAKRTYHKGRYAGLEKGFKSKMDMLQTCPFPSPDPPRLLLLSPPLQRWMGTRTPRSSKPYGLPQWTVRLVREHLADGTALHPPSLVTLEHRDKGDGVKRRGWVGLAEGLGKVLTGHPTMWRPLLHDHPMCTQRHTHPFRRQSLRVKPSNPIRTEYMFISLSDRIFFSFNFSLHNLFSAFCFTSTRHSHLSVSSDSLPLQHNLFMTLWL